MKPMTNSQTGKENNSRVLNDTYSNLIKCKLWHNIFWLKLSKSFLRLEDEILTFSIQQYIQVPKYESQINQRNEIIN